MTIRPIFSALRRHKTAAALIILEIALSCAIICNAVFIIGNRVERMQRDSGMTESELLFIQSISTNVGANPDSQRDEDLAALRAVPGVQSVTSVNQMPYGNSSWTSGVSLSNDQDESTANPTIYQDDGTLLQTLGVRLLEGRFFEAGEYQEGSALSAPGSDLKVPSAIMTRDLALRLYPDGDALGKPFFNGGGEPIRIVGIIDKLLRPRENNGPTHDYESLIFPTRESLGIYVLRTAPERRAEVLAAAVAALNKVDPNRIIDDQLPVSEMRDKSYSRDRAVIWLLVVVCIALLAVTALGIVGLASFWVQQRTKQIGIRRALGATRLQILQYFQTENFLLTSVGIVIGMLLAYMLNLMLMSHYEMPRLPLLYLPAGAVVLWLLGQAAVFGPARRAAAVPPAVATRGG